MQKVKKALLVILLACFAYYEMRHLNHNFTESAVCLESWPEIKTPRTHTKEQIAVANAILKQRFLYLGKGRQCFAFASEDGKYVLKLIKSHNLQPNAILDNFPLPSFLDRLRRASIKERETRVSVLFISLRLAEKELVDETGVLFVHMQADADLQQTVRVQDRLGLNHEINVRKVPFVLQRKAAPAMPYLLSLLKAGKFAEVNQRLDQLINLILTRANRGIVDPDGRLLKNNNIGFLDDRAIYIDTGTFFRSYKSTDREHLASDFRQLRPLVQLLKEYDLELAKSFTARMNQAIDTHAS